MLSRVSFIVPDGYTDLDTRYTIHRTQSTEHTDPEENNGTLEAPTTLNLNLELFLGRGHRWRSLRACPGAMIRD